MASLLNHFSQVAPQIIITVNGKRAHALETRLVSLNITDAAGFEGDRATLQLTNADLEIELPQDGQRFELAFKYDLKAPQTLGIYSVEKISGKGAPHMITIEGHAAPLTSSIRTPRTHTYKSISLQDLVDLIALKHGFKAAVDPDFGSIFYDYLAQTAESDLHLLTRLARELDAIFKPIEGHLLFIKRGAQYSVSGQKLEPLDVHLSDLSSYSWSREARKNIKSVEAQYIDPQTGQSKTVSVGKDAPKLTLRHMYATKEQALKAIQAARDKNWRAYQTWDCTFPTFRGDLFVGSMVTLKDVQIELRGKWSVCKVNHSANGSSFIGTKIEMERLIE